jgi:hypothetical protein
MHLTVTIENCLLAFTVKEKGGGGTVDIQYMHAYFLSGWGGRVLMLVVATLGMLQLMIL